MITCYYIKQVSHWNHFICIPIPVLSQHGDVYPKSQVAYQGSTVVMVCVSIITPRWTKLGIPVERGETFKNTLVLHNVTEEDNGIYYCHGFHYKKKFAASSELLVGGN